MIVIWIFNNIYNDLGNITIYEIEDINGFKYTTTLAIGYLVRPIGENYEAYLQFDIIWIHLQLRIFNNGFGFKWRVKHGNNDWTDWSNI